MLPEPLLDEAARRFGLLADASRLRILRVLHEGEQSPGAIAEATGLTPPNVSQHLARLLAAGMIGRRREAGTALYRITDPTLDGLCELVCAGLRTRAEALAGS
jgi:DNA-binding transcriptional ArsR family regulator